MNKDLTVGTKKIEANTQPLGEINVFIASPLTPAKGEWYDAALGIDAILEDVYAKGYVLEGQDYIVSDTENDLGLSLNSLGMDEIAEIADFIDTLDSYEKNQFVACYEHNGDFDNAEQYYQEWHFLCDYEYQIREALFDIWLETAEIPQHIPTMYLDSETIGRDMEMETFTQETSEGVYYAHQY